MSNQQTNANRTDKQYFNLHLEGFANLYNARWIQPKQGQSFEPFLQVRGANLGNKPCLLHNQGVQIHDQQRIHLSEKIKMK